MMSNLKFIAVISVYSGLRQILVHVGTLLIRGLFHHPAFLRLHLSQQELDWPPVPQGAEVDDSSRHSAVP